MLFKIIVLLSLFGAVIADIDVVPLEAIPASHHSIFNRKYGLPGYGCYLHEIKEFLLVGQIRQSKTKCMKYQCFKNHVKYVTCGKIFSVPKNCKIVKKRDKAYPDCCPAVECH